MTSQGQGLPTTHLQSSHAWYLHSECLSDKYLDKHNQSCDKCPKVRTSPSHHGSLRHSPKCLSQMGNFFEVSFLILALWFIFYFLVRSCSFQKITLQKVGKVGIVRMLCEVPSWQSLSSTGPWQQVPGQGTVFLKLLQDLVRVWKAKRKLAQNRGEK